MPFIRSGVVTEFHMVIADRTDDVEEADVYSEVLSSKAISIPSRHYPSNPYQSLRTLVRFTMENPLPPHFTPGQWSWEIDYTWNLVFGFQSWLHVDSIWLRKPLSPQDVPGPNFDVAAGSSSGSRRIVESGLPYQRGYERLDTEVAMGRESGNRSIYVSVNSVSLTYDEYVPDTRGGNWRNLADFQMDVNGGGELVGDAFVYTGKHAISGIYVSMPPAYTDEIGLAEYSEDGVEWKPGVVYKITILDYELRYANEHPALLFSDDIHHIGIYPWEFVTARMPVGPAADPYGRVGYVCVPDHSGYLSFSMDGLSMVRFRVEVYSTLPPPIIAPFWTDFQRTREILSEE